MRKFFVILMAGIVLSLGGGILLGSSEEGASVEATQFEEIGSFRVTQAVLVKLGIATEVPKGDTILRVFSDGIDIRISPEGQDEDFLAFQIYQTGGIFDSTGKNLLPGVQAFSDQGQVIRHLVVNRKLLTITKFPTLTSDVEIIYATRHEH